MMIAQQIQIDRIPVRQPMVQVDGASQLHGQLVVAWSQVVARPDRDAERAAAARAAARAVSRVCGCPEELIALSHRTGAGPIPMRWHERLAQPLPCVVSIAHTEGRAVAAAAGAGRIGADLERAGSVDPAELRMFATSAERALGLDPTLLWTLKEAAWKAFACTEEIPFTALTVAAFTVSLASPTYVVFRLRDDFIAASAYIWQPWPDWLATVVEVA